MADLDKPTLSQSSVGPDGRQIQIPVGAITPATAVVIFSTGDAQSASRSVAPSPATGDRWWIVTIECSNLSGFDKQLYLAWGGVQSGDIVVKTVPFLETVTVVQRRRVRGMNIKAYEPSGSGLLNVYVEVEEAVEPKVK